MKSLKLLFVVLSLGMVLLAACTPQATPTAAPTAAPTTAAPTAEATVAIPTPEPITDPDADKRGGTIVIGSPQEPSVLNPLLSASSIEDAVSALIIEGLVEIDAEGNFVPVLAEALPEPSEEGLVLTYKLRQGVKFSNGDDFTCADVVYTYEAIMSDLSGVSTAGYRDIDEIECVDDYTVKVYMGYLYAPYLRMFSFIIPQAAGDFAELDNWAFNRNPIGTGPWMVKDWRAGDTITFAPNPYFREEGKPYLDQVVIKVLPSREVGMQLLGTGELDVLWDLIEADFAQLEAMADRGVRWAAAITGENELLVFNLADPTVDAPPDPAAAPHPILSDLRVRQAIEMAIDKQLIVDALLYGNVRVGTSVLPLGEYECPVPPSKYDVEGAKALLESAGWVAGADGIRQKDGVRMSLKITSQAGNQLREQTQQVLVEMFKAVGIELVIDNVPSDVLFAGWNANGLRSHGRFDILMYTTGPYPFSPDNHLFSNYHSARIPTADNEGAGANYSRWINEDVDLWIDDAFGTTDEAARHDYFCRVVNAIAEEKPRVMLYERLLISGYREHLQNFRISPGFADFAVDSESWWLKK